MNLGLWAFRQPTFTQVKLTILNICKVPWALVSYIYAVFLHALSHRQRSFPCPSSSLHISLTVAVPSQPPLLLLRQSWQACGPIIARPGSSAMWNVTLCPRARRAPDGRVWVDGRQPVSEISGVSFAVFGAFYHESICRSFRGLGCLCFIYK